ncbi:DUF5110 domain-containing protein [Parvularcula sp. ZS-1/3]|uniref:DUF5110 domain-containing protein n=1 Tax=Parvularcula mediterranea TaxID=2732508 RepID=A0A7Y3W4X9_9PROT|nr:TIM-barrel domain-containing protein [Parvularcula mediterranea]NNU15953.1 DUF5110 domain-containing protein [Parvularcula mediterranea]
MSGTAGAPGRSLSVSATIAIFEPPQFDPSQTLPSLMLNGEPETSPLEDPWPTTPSFGEAHGKRTVDIAIDRDTDLYGTGEVTGPLRRNGQTIELWNTDNPSYRRVQGQRLYQSHPWVLGVRPDGSAFGILHDSTWRQSLICGRTIRFETDGPAARVIVILGEDAMDVLRQLSNLTGKMEMPPLWALGYNQCRWSYYPDARVREIANEFRSRKIPLDVIWVDIHYMDDYRVFTFDPERFPDPAATNAYLHERDVKAVWMIDPGVAKQDGYSVYNSGEARDVWIKTADGQPAQGEVWPGQTVFPDFTTKEAVHWWSEQYQDFLAVGIDGVWNDMNEPAIFDAETWTLPEDAVHRGGAAHAGLPIPEGPHLRYHNAYGMLMARATRDAVLKAKPDKRPFVLTRANVLGGHRYCATWTGDNRSCWHHLKMSIPMSVNLSLSGQPFHGPDIGGFEGEAWPELFAEWMAIGAFFPFCRGHTIEKSADHEPWSFGPETEEVCRVALRRRYALMPYLYTLFRRASETGAPVMLPAFLADPAEEELRFCDDRFLLGSDLAVEPGWADKTISLPEDWRLIPPLAEEVPGDIHPALRLRPGGLIPACAPAVSTEALTLETLTLHVNFDQDGHATGSLYWDEREGFGFENGAYTDLSFVCQRTDAGATLKVTAAGQRPLPAETKIIVIDVANAEQPVLATRLGAVL